MCILGNGRFLEFPSALGASGMSRLRSVRVLDFPERGVIDHVFREER